MYGKDEKRLIKGYLNSINLSLSRSLLSLQAVFGFSSILIYLWPPCWYACKQIKDLEEAGMQIDG